MKYYITSDHHFGHTNIIKHCHRPFDSVDDMDKAMLDNWLSVVGKNDIVYFLGDLALRNWGSYYSKLSGQIHFIRGNHDKMSNTALLNHKKTLSVSNLKEIKYKDIHITLCHYAMRSWNKSCHGALHFYGHSHGNLFPVERAYDVGVDINGFMPILLDDAIDLARTYWHLKNL